jgi:hypothetical protein
VGSAQDGGDGGDFCFGDVGRGKRDGRIHSACSGEWISELAVLRTC